MCKWTLALEQIVGAGCGVWSLPQLILQNN